ncbi:hypothetical protein FOL47_010809 [Perkinsus chesapeaki]|uniref:Uncharacterized protein n=1 Tax=Perkinsus chesapeaki TaxID=330153 RepID=A0A7J6L142_PERCH|nr:hypothetical protein FOL47_010809 [Perkinsus chesapeaki]
MAIGCSTESVRVLAIMLATMWLMVFHLMGCDNDCTFDIGTYERSRDGITYRVMIDYAGDEFFNADLTFTKNGVPFSCLGCEFAYLNGRFHCRGCGESTNDLEELVEYGNIGSSNYIGLYMPDNCTLYYLTSQKSPDVELIKIYD